MQRSANPLFLKVFSNGCRCIVFFGVVLVTLAGCTLFGGGPKIATPDVGGFAVKGRMAVRHDDDGFTSNFLWQHAKGRDEIDLWGPMGQGHSRLVGGENDVTVYTAKGDVYHERDPDAAMQKWLGFALPIGALTHWIRGERAPGYPVDSEVRGETGELMTLDQLTWRLEFLQLSPLRSGTASADADHRDARRHESHADPRGMVVRASVRTPPGTRSGIRTRLTPRRPIIKIPPFRESGHTPAQSLIFVESTTWGVAKR